jgi:hypothetical protein
MHAGLGAGKPRGRTVMSHAQQGGQAPDQANSGHQAGAAALTQTDHSEGTHNGQFPRMSHMRHGNTRLATVPDRPTQRVSQFPERHHFDPPHRIEPERLCESLLALWQRAES